MPRAARVGAFWKARAPRAAWRFRGAKHFRAFCIAALLLEITHSLRRQFFLSAQTFFISSLIFLPVCADNLYYKLCNVCYKLSNMRYKLCNKNFLPDSENCLRKEGKLSCRKENFSRSSCDLSRYVARSYRNVCARRVQRPTNLFGRAMPSRRQFSCKRVQSSLLLLPGVAENVKF